MPVQGTRAAGPDAVNARAQRWHLNVGWRTENVIISKMDHLGVMTVRDRTWPSATASPWKGSPKKASRRRPLASVPPVLGTHSLLLRGGLALHAQGGVHALVLHAQLVHLHAVLLLQRLALALQLPGLLAGRPGPGTGEGGGHGRATAGAGMPTGPPAVPSRTAGAGEQQQLCSPGEGRALGAGHGEEPWF